MSKKTKRDTGLVWAIVLLSLGILLIFFPFNILDGIRFSKFQLDTQEYNKLGDFINGVTSPFIAISAFILLYMTYKSQAEELKQTREVLKTQTATLDKQQFETTFFNLLNLHHQIINNIDLKLGSVMLTKLTGQPRPDRKTGRDCFVTFYKGFISTYQSIKEDKMNLDEISIINESYSKYYKIHQSDLGHYFRNLYHIVKFVNNSTITNREDYTSIIRAQLSSHEQLLLFYNCLSNYGKKFKPLIEDYHLLKNIPTEDLIIVSHKDLYKGTAYQRLKELSPITAV